MKTTQTNETEKQQFMIYREGRLDKAYYFKVQARRLLRSTRKAAYSSLETGLDALDQVMYPNRVNG